MKDFIKSVIIMAGIFGVIMAVTFLTGIYPNVMYPIITLVITIGILYIGKALLDAFLWGNKKRKLFKYRHVEQQKVRKGKKLPIYRYREIYLYFIIVVIMVFYLFIPESNIFVVIVFTLCCFFNCTEQGHIIVFVFWGGTILFLLMPSFEMLDVIKMAITSTLCTLLYLVHLSYRNIKNSLIFAKKEFQEKYIVDNEYYGNISYNEINELIHIISFKTNGIRENIVNNKMEILQLKKGINEFDIGTIVQTIRENNNYRNTDIFYKYPKKVFVEMMLPYHIDGTIVLQSISYEDESRSIIPKYSNIPTILCDSDKKEYTERIINEKVQLYISKLAKRLGKYSIWFSGNKVTVILHNVLWSSWLSRTFLAKKSSKNICISVDEIVNTLEKIEYEIQNSI